MSSSSTPPITRIKQRQGRQVLEILGKAGAWMPFEGDGDPAGEARRRVLAQVKANTPVIGVIGLGLGDVLDAVDEIAPSCHVVALELSSAMGALSGSAPKVRARLDAGRLTIAVAPTYEALGDATARAALARADPSLPLVISPALAAGHGDALGVATNVLRQRLFEAKANDDARRANAGRYLLNTLRNLPAIEREGDVASLANLFPNAPAIVIAAGPTLDKTLEDLRAGAAHAVIIAVDTALKPLLAAGVRPDLVVAMDPTEQNARHLYDVPDLPNTWLVAEPSVNPAILRAFSERSFLLSLGFDPWPWIGRSGISRGKLRAWGSVATTAYDLALVLGCNPIGLLGLDFSFPGGQPYCRNTEYEHDWADAAAWGDSLETTWHAWTHRWRDVTEPDVNGRPVLTAPHLVAFRDWVLKDIQRNAAERRIVNAGGGILAGASVIRKPIRELVSREFDARNIVPAALHAAHVPPANGPDLTRARRVLIEALTSAAGPSPIESPLQEWIRFAPATSPDDVVKALIESPELVARRSAGPHLVPEQAARLRSMLTGDMDLERAGSGVDSEAVLRLCREALNSAPASAVRYSGRLQEDASGRSVLASALVEWTGTGYALVRQLEAELSHGQAEAADAFGRGAVERLADAPALRSIPASAASIAVVRETALVLSLGVADSSALLKNVLRAIDPACGAGELSCRIRIGFGIEATASLRGTDLGRVLTGRIASPADVATTEIGAGSVGVSLSAESAGSRVLRFLGPGVRVVPPRVLSSPEFGAALFGTTVDARTAVLNSIGGSFSVRVCEDGRFEMMPSWPHAIIGEIPDTSGGWIAWSNYIADPVLMRRTPEGTVDIVLEAPFRPNRVVEWEGQFLCSAHEGGLWSWKPGEAARKLTDAPPVLSLSKASGGVRLDPLVRSPLGHTTRARLEHAFVWRNGEGLTRLALDSMGPCWSVASTGEWTAHAYPHDDLVRLTDDSGRIVDLACYYPVTVAWAGRSLIVLSSTSGTILLFENLRDALTCEPL